MAEPRIVSAKIYFAQDLIDLTIVDGSAKANLVFDDGSLAEFAWFHDEVTFTEEEFIGKTMKEVRELHREKDVAWLRS